VSAQQWPLVENVQAAAVTLMNIMHCRVSATLTPSTNVTTYLLTYLQERLKNIEIFVHPCEAKTDE